MPHTHEHRLYSVACTQHGSDTFRPVVQGGAGAAPGAGVPVRPDEATLGTTQAGQAGDHADMRGDAQPSRMGQAVSVKHEEVGSQHEFPQGRDDGGALAKGKQAGDVGHAQLPGGDAGLAYAALAQVPDDDASQAPRAPRREGRVDAGHVA